MMQLEHSFTVPVGADRTWEILNDIETVVPCMPGATLNEFDGDEFTGHVKVKVGPMQVTYEGQASFVERDRENLTATIEAKGDQQRGAGSAHATVNARLVEEDDGATTVIVTTELQVTGRPAQFGRGVMADVGDKLLGQFADCLSREIIDSDGAEDAEVETAGRDEADDEAGDEGDEPGPDDEATEEPGRGAPKGAPRSAHPEDRRRRVERGRREEQEDEAVIDLLEVAGPSVAKRVVPVLAVAALVAFVWWLVRRGEGE